MEAETLLIAEFSALVGLAGLILVFIPFFLQRLGQSREKMPTATARRVSIVIWIVGSSLILPVSGATAALVTLWDGPDLSVLTDVLTLATVWLVFALALLSMTIEGIWG